jgi:hypothetical protein
MKKCYSFLLLIPPNSLFQVDEGRQNSVVAQADTVKKWAPYLIQSLRDAIRKPGNVHFRDCKDFFFNSARNSVESLIQTFEQVKNIEKNYFFPSSFYVVNI